MTRLALVLAAGCAGAEGDPPVAALATEILDAPGASDAPFHDPALAVNGVRGAGLSAGSTDVFSLAVDGPEASLTLGWDGDRVVDGPGVDLVVYENPFAYPGGVFLDPVVVELSSDGLRWVAFPHAGPPAYVPDPAAWEGFAGLTPVLLHEEEHPTDPLDTSVSGGDGFDLADLPDTAEARRIRSRGACCVRLWSASAWEDPDTGAPYPLDPTSNGADIDGVYGRISRSGPETP